MKLSPSNLSAKIAFLTGYPALSVLFLVLGLGDLWNPWSLIFAAGVILFVGGVMFKPIVVHPSLDSLAPIVFHLWAWICSLLYTAALTGGDLTYAGLGVILNTLILYLVTTVLEKRDLLNKLYDKRFEIWMLYWLLFISSASVPTSMGLARLNHMMSLVPISIYSIAFGWFGPQVIPRVVHGNLRPLLLVGVYFFLILVLYGLIETVNPALRYLTPDSGIVLLVSYVGCHSMLVSRCTLEAVKTA